jgi:hypothetical protein
MTQPTRDAGNDEQDLDFGSSGINYYYVIAQDNAGNLGSSSYDTIYIDLHAPELTNANFIDEGYSPNWYTTNGTSYAQIGVFYNVAPTGGSTTFNIPITGQVDGSYSISFFINNTAGTETSDTTGLFGDAPLRLDSTGPEGYSAVMTSGAFYENITNDMSPELIISGAFDAGGVGLHSAPYLFGWRSNAGPWTFSNFISSNTYSPVLSLDSNNWDFAGGVRDALGNRGSLVFDNDNTVEDDPPSGALIYQITEDLLPDYLYVAGSTIYYSNVGLGDRVFTIYVAASDAISGLEKSIYPATVSAGGENSTDQGGPWAYTWKYTADGLSETFNGSILVEIYDKANNSVSVEFSVILDDMNPNFSSLSFEEDSEFLYTSGAVLFYGDDMPIEQHLLVTANGVSDDISGVFDVEFPAFFGKPAYNLTTSPYEMEYDIDDSDSDSGTFTVIVLDNVGNSISISWAIIRDITDPVVEINSFSDPNDWFYVSGETFYYGDDMDASYPVVVNVSASDASAGVFAVEFPDYFGIGDDWNDTISSYSRSYDVGPSDANNGIFTVICYDNVGNSYTDSWEVYRDTINPSATPVILEPSSDFIYLPNEYTLYYGSDMPSAIPITFVASGIFDTQSGWAKVKWPAWLGESTVNISNPSNSHIYFIDSSDIDNGSLVVYYWDNVGNNASISFYTYRDITDPITNLSSLTESPFSDYLHIIGQTVYFSDLMGSSDVGFTVAVNAADISSGVRFVEFGAWSNEQIALNDSSTPYLRGYTIDSDELSGSIIIRALDNVGNWASMNVTLIIAKDTLIPSFSSFTISDPSIFTYSDGTTYYYGDEMNSTIAVDVTTVGISDSGSGIYAVMFPAFWNQSTAWNDTISSYGRTYGISSSEGDTGSFNVVVFDNVGNKAIRFWTIRRDAAAPTYTDLTQTSSNPEYDESNGISVSVSEPVDASGIDAIVLNYKVNNGSWVYKDVTAASSYTFTADMLRYNQTYAWYFIFNDSVGNSNQTPMQSFAVVDNTAPSYSDLDQTTSTPEYDAPNTVSVNVVEPEDASNISTILLWYRMNFGPWKSEDVTVASNYTFTEDKYSYGHICEWYFLYIDGAGNSGTTQAKSFFVVDRTDPIYSNLHQTTSTPEYDDQMLAV